MVGSLLTAVQEFASSSIEMFLRSYCISFTRYLSLDLLCGAGQRASKNPPSRSPVMPLQKLCVSCSMI